MKNVESLEFREMKPDELESGLEIRNSIFAPITPEDWRQGDPKTAAIAFKGSEAIGFIPLYIRDMKLVPGVTIKTALENAVGTRAEYRGQGVGTKMIEAACGFMKGKVDALCVYRSNERSQGYNFYQKTGHVDLLHMRNYVNFRIKGCFDDRVVISEGKKKILESQGRLTEVFEETYSTFGGFPPRFYGYWERALNSPIYNAKPVKLYFFKLVERDMITAYMITAVKQHPESDEEKGRLQILEMAACGSELAGMRRVIETAFAFAEKEGLRSIYLETSDDCPFISLLEESGFTAGIRIRHLMNHNIDLQELFNTAWKQRLHIPGVALKVWTPKRELILAEPEENSKREMVLEMKEDTLTRWLMGRADLKARIHEGSITVLNANSAIIDDIAKAIPSTRWAYHSIDLT